MRIEDLTEAQVPPGTRIRVTGVAPSEVEDLGYVDDTERLLDQKGTVQELRKGRWWAQLDIQWDDPSIRLHLSDRDEVEVLHGPA